MELANQIVYLAALIMLFGMTFSAYKGLSSSVKSENAAFFWFVALISQLVSFACFYLYPYLGDWTLLIGNVSQLAVDILLLLLFRSLRVDVPKFYVFTIGWWLLLYAVIFLSLDFTHAVTIGCVLTIVLSSWQIYELLLLQRQRYSLFILFLIAAIALQMVLCSLRIVLAHTDMNLASHMLLHKSMYDDDALELQIRMMLVFLYVLIFMGIGNYFFEKVWWRLDALVHTREEQMLSTLQSLASSRDNETGKHLVRTQAYVRLLCHSLRSMGCYVEALTDDYIDQLVRVTPLHDIGKVGIPDEVLLKHGPHDAREREIMKTHAALGERILKLSGAASNDLLIQTAAAMAGSHHEHWDGTGYPQGLVGEAIPLAARIMALADIYDALTTSRVYKAAWSHEDATAEILRQKGKGLDPLVVEAFMNEKEAFRQIAEQMKG